MSILFCYRTGGSNQIANIDNTLKLAHTALVEANNAINTLNYARKQLCDVIQALEVACK